MILVGSGQGIGSVSSCRKHYPPAVRLGTLVRICTAPHGLAIGGPWQRALVAAALRCAASTCSPWSLCKGQVITLDFVSDSLVYAYGIFLPRLRLDHLQRRGSLFSGWLQRHLHRGEPHADLEHVPDEIGICTIEGLFVCPGNVSRPFTRS